MAVSKKQSKKAKATKKLAKAPVQVLDGTPEAKKVKEFTQYVRKVLATKELEAQLEIGKRCLKDFFDNNEEMALKRNPHRKAAWALLKGKIESGELELSMKRLQQSIKLAVHERRQLRAGKADAYLQLNKGQRMELLKVADNTNTTAKLAQKAVEEKLTVRELHGAVREHRGKDPVRRNVRRTRHDFMLTIAPTDVQDFTMLGDYVRVVVHLPVDDELVRELVNSSILNKR